MTDPEVCKDKKGNFHDENGRFINLRDYVERIFYEKDKLAEAQRVTLERAVTEARVTTDRAMVEAKNTVEARLIEAKTAADAVQMANVKRLENLESGGAPFASRLDDSITTLKADVNNLKINLGPAFESEHLNLKADVAILKENMVKTTVLDALRQQTVDDARTQKRQIRNLYWTVGGTLMASMLNIIVLVVTHGHY